MNSKDIEILKRVKFLIEYNLKKTYTENLIEQDTEIKNDETYQVTPTDAPAVQGTPQMLTMQISSPDGQIFVIPKESKVFHYDNDMFYFNTGGFKNWISKEKGGNGTEKTDAWIPKNGRRVYPNAVSSFILPNKEEYLSTWEIKGYNPEKPNPNAWVFKGYFTKNGKPYVEDKGLIGNFVREHEEGLKMLLWIGGAIVAGLLTGGLADILIGAEMVSAEAFAIANYTVSTRALAVYLGEAGVWSTKGAIEINEGNYAGGAVDFLFAFILPLCHKSYFQLGINATEKQVAELGAKVIGKTDEEIVELFTKGVKEGGLSQQEKQLFRRITTIAPEKYNEILVPVFKKADNILKSQGRNSQTVMKDILTKLQGRVILAGSELAESWLEKFGGTLVHDLAVIQLVNMIAKKFGKDAESVTEKMLKDIEQSKKEEGEVGVNKKVNEYAEIVKSSSDTLQLQKEYEKNNPIDKPIEKRTPEQMVKLKDLLKVLDPKPTSNDSTNTNKVSPHPITNEN